MDLSPYSRVTCFEIRLLSDNLSEGVFFKKKNDVIDLKSAILDPSFFMPLNSVQKETERKKKEKKKKGPLDFDIVDMEN